MAAGVYANWHSAYVEDSEERRAYVTAEDTRKLAEYYKIHLFNNNKFTWFIYLAGITTGIMIGIILMSWIK